MRQRRARPCPSDKLVKPRMSQNMIVIVADLAAEHELFRVRRQLLDVMRRHVARERAADFALARLGPQIAEQGANR